MAIPKLLLTLAFGIFQGSTISSQLPITSLSGIASQGESTSDQVILAQGF